MRELGYVEGRNVIIEWRYADGNYQSLPDLAAELTRMDLEVIVVYGTAAVQALKKATNSIPIVAAAAVDLVGSGIAESLGQGARVDDPAVVTAARGSNHRIG
jgi:putative ABC transport system substrate-binding protein